LRRHGVTGDAADLDSGFLRDCVKRREAYPAELKLGASQ
jgi:hypothetical protein